MESHSNQQIASCGAVQVTAILVQSGLSRLLTGSIIAHEVMHAWLRYRHVRELSLDGEEGLCQLMASLWLDSQRAAAQEVKVPVTDSYNDRLDTLNIPHQFESAGVRDDARGMACRCHESH